MMQNATLPTSLNNIGEDIGLEAAERLVSNFQTAYPNETPSFLVGRKIIDLILSQPNCQGLKIYNGLDESGEKTLVYLATDDQGKNILQVTSVSNEGTLEKSCAIVGDRVVKPGPRTGIIADDWEWTID
jgi:hypothetical protein